MDTGSGDLVPGGGVVDTSATYAIGGQSDGDGAGGRAIDVDSVEHWLATRPE